MVRDNTTQLRRVRLGKRLKLCELASQADVGIGSLCVWERGYKKPTLPTAQKLANALGCDVDDIFDSGKLKV